MATYEIWLDEPNGNRLKLLDKVESFNATKLVNNKGVLSMILPPDYDSYIKLDGIIEIWRKGDEGSLKLFNAYFIRKWEFIDKNGVDITVISGYDGVDLLDRRIVAYAAASATSAKTDYADDMIKAVVVENLGGSATDTDRDLSGYDIDIDADLSDAPSLTMNFAYRNVLNLARDIADSSRKSGTRLYFDVQPKIVTGDKMGWQVVTSVDQPRQDRTGTDQVFFGKKWGNLSGARITYDHTNEKTVVYAGGQGLEADRTVEEREDTDRSGASIYNRIEGFYNVSGQAETQAAVQAAGDARLSELRPAFRFSGVLKDTPQARLFVDWNFGDRVVVEYRDRQLNAIITSLTLALSNDGNETISAGFEVLDERD